MTYDWISVNGEKFALVRPEDLPASPPEAQACAVDWGDARSTMNEAAACIRRLLAFVPKATTFPGPHYDVKDQAGSVLSGLERLVAARRPSEAGEAETRAHERVRINFQALMVDAMTSGGEAVYAANMTESLVALIDERIRRASATGGEGCK